MKSFIPFILPFLFCSLLSCENDLGEIQALIPPDQVKVETIRDFETLYSDSAIVRVRIKGPTLIRHLDDRNPRQEFPEGVSVDFFGPSRTISSQLTANYAIRYEKEGQIIVRDSVVWKNATRETLETEELIWDEKEGRVFTNKFVIVRRPDEILYGYGFESNQDFTKSRIKAVEGRIQLNKDF